MEVQVTGFKLEGKYLPFLIEKDGQTIVESSGFVDGKLALTFSDGLKGSFGFVPENKDIEKAIKNKGYFVVDGVTGVSTAFIYEEAKPAKSGSSSRTGSNQKRVSW